MSSDSRKKDISSDETKAHPGGEVGGNEPTTPPTETQGHIPMPGGLDFPKRIGQYSIRRAIASGGMGTVYEAVQEKPRRTVALKVMRRGIASRSALRRFEYESQLLARLRHPGIAQVYDAGTHRDGDVTVPYFAMEYIVGGKPVTDYVKDKKLGTRERLKLFTDVCAAVHHGHQRGIIHRDLKPSNILVDSSGQVKIIDFGVARSTDSDMAVTTLQTDIGQLIGTLQYMSPEQCAADPHDIDTRSDVYALGVVFYEMLCERLPYDLKGAAIHEATRVIREQQPTKLSTLNKTLRGDVETIALKALEKDRDRRYQSASGFGDDVERYLNNETIEARRSSLWYVLITFVRRNRIPCLAFAAIMITLLAATVVSLSLYARADLERERAVEAEQRAVSSADKADRITTFLQDMLSSANPYDTGDRDMKVVDMLDRAAARAAEQLAGQPEVEADVRRTIGSTFQKLALYDQSERELRRSVELSVLCYGEDHIVVADTLHTLFWVLEKAGKYDESEEACLRSLAIRRRLFGDTHVAVADSLDALGDLYGYMGDLKRAKEVMLRAHDIYRSLPGEMPHNHLNNFALIRRQSGEFTEAESLFRSAIAGAQREFGEDHPQTDLYWENLGLMLTWDSRFAEAEANYSKTCAAWTAALGATHPYTLSAVHHWAETQARLGRLVEAEVTASQAVAGYRESMATDGVEYAHALSILGMVQIALDKPSDAEAALREALGIRQQVAPESWRVSETMSLLGAALALGGRFVEAEEPLLAGYAGIPADALVPYAKGEAAARVVVAYESWNAAEPGKGYDAKAEEWRAKLSKQNGSNDES